MTFKNGDLVEGQKGANSADCGGGGSAGGGGAGSIRKVAAKPMQEWVAPPIAVVEEKPAGPRQGLLAWTKARNDREDDEVKVLLAHISRFLGAA